MKNKLKVHKIKLLGQDYLIKTSGSSNMSEVVCYVEDKMKEVMDSGVDSNSQQLRIAFRHQYTGSHLSPFLIICLNLEIL